jgi:hypothetical protein
LHNFYTLTSSFTSGTNNDITFTITNEQKEKSILGLAEDVVRLEAALVVAMRDLGALKRLGEIMARSQKVWNNGIGKEQEVAEKLEAKKQEIDGLVNRKEGFEAELGTMTQNKELLEKEVQVLVRVFVLGFIFIHVFIFFIFLLLHILFYFFIFLFIVVIVVEVLIHSR